MQLNITQLVQVGEILILNCGIYKDELKTWHQMPVAQLTRTVFKAHFTEAYALCHKMLGSTATSSHGYANNT